MDAKDFIRSALVQAEPCINEIQQFQMSNPTPCSEWDLSELLKHLIGELLWIPDLLAGKTIAEVGDRYDGDIIGKDPQSAWQRASHAALEALAGVKLSTKVHLSYGDVSVEYYINEVACDVLIHGWDVAQSIGCNQIFGKELTLNALALIRPKAQKLADSGLFGYPIKTTEKDDIQTQLLALVGRRANRVSKNV